MNKLDSNKNENFDKDIIKLNTSCEMTEDQNKVLNELIIMNSNFK
jgi:hypothetical protein